VPHPKIVYQYNDLIASVISSLNHCNQMKKSSKRKYMDLDRDPEGQIGYVSGSM
jgi:hypothetical protein